MADVISCLSNTIRAELCGAVSTLVPDDETIKTTIEYAKKNQILDIVGRGILDLKYPITNAEQLSSWIRQEILLSMYQEKALSMIVNTFEKEKIRFQVLKGAIMKNYYPKKDMRSMSDLDILIDESNMDIVVGIMKSLGFELKQKEDHHDIYMNSEYILVEIHRYLYDRITDKKQHNYFLSFNRSHLKQNYNYYYEFTPEDFYVYMIAHMARHFSQRGCGIRNVIDIYVFMNKFSQTLDFNYLERELTYCGLYTFEKHMRKLSEIWLNTSQWTDFYVSLFSYMADCGVYGKDENGIWCKYANEHIKTKKIAKLRLKIWYYFPGKYYLVDDYPWLDKHTYLLPVAWIIRGTGGIFYHKGKDKLDLLKRINVEEINQTYEIYKKLKLDFHANSTKPT